MSTAQDNQAWALCLSRRRVLLAGASLLAASAVKAAGANGSLVEVEEYSARGQSQGIHKLGRVVKSDADWRKQLSPLAYQVTRKAATERAGSGQYAQFHGDGLYRCICCNTALYDSRTKFESGTGWPSFWKPISKFNVMEARDDALGMERNEISCTLCDAHLGHVFDDGPRPTGLRYCMNSVALNFVSRG